jgi:hypothetical protein
MLIYLYTILFAGFAVVYTEILLAPGGILGWWDKLLHKYVKADWLLMPLADCVFCVGGQAAFWGYLLVVERYWFLEHILFTTFTIFLINIYERIKAAAAGQE